MRSDPVAWLYDLQDRGVKLGLDGIRGLLGLLDHPERRQRIVLVAGTNGKGSVSAMLDAMLGASGLRVGLYTSPHLVHPRERIRIGGADLEAAALDRLLERLRSVCEGGIATGALGEHPSFFEVMTAAACLAFAEAGVDLAILEVGLGGRLDATNAAEPVVSVIVSVEIDHVAQLGPTLAAIAAEKAGIVRPGRPLVCGVELAEPLSVIRARCDALGADLVEARRIATIERGASGSFAVTTPRGRYEGLALSLAGDHQRDNALVAVAAVERIGDALGLAVDTEAVRRGLAATRWPGRLQWLPGDPDVLLDGAHNAAGSRALAAYVDGRGGRPPVLLFATMRDKDLEGVLGPLARRAAVVVVTRPDVSRAATPADLSRAASRWCPRTHVAGDTETGLAIGRRLARDHGTYLLVAGSLYLVGEALGLLRGSEGPGPVAM